jgi:hypothetical protein
VRFSIVGVIFAYLRVMGKFKLQKPNVMGQTREPPILDFDTSSPTVSTDIILHRQWRPATIPKTGRDRKAKRVGILKLN